MTIVYCDWATGDDTNGTGTWDHPYKSITKASTGLTGGDEVRVAKSPEPTALTGTLGFTNDSTAVTGSGTAFTTELAIGDFILGGDDNWWEVVTITSDTAAALYKKYSGSTESGVSSQKLGVTDTGAAASNDANIQYINSSGTGSAYLKISGGWDLSTQTQTGQTYFRSLDTANINNRWGRGLAGWSKNCIEISKLNFLRYYRAIRMDSNTCDCNIIEPFIASCNDGICFVNAYNINIISPTFVGCTAICIVADKSFNIKVYGTVKAYSCNPGVFMSNVSTMLINKAELIYSTCTYGFANYTNSRIFINNISGNSEIWTDYANAVRQDATAGGTGKEWKLSITGSNRGTHYPFSVAVAAVPVNANKQVTVKLYFKKSGTGIAGRLFVRGGQIAGVDDDIYTECPNDTNRNQVTLQFTPTEKGVVEIEVQAWYVSSTAQNIIVDDIDISQAD